MTLNTNLRHDITEGLESTWRPNKYRNEQKMDIEVDYPFNISCN